MYFEIVDKTEDDYAAKLPTRATATSAGYDFYLPRTWTCPPHKTTIISLCVRAMPGCNSGGVSTEHNWVLLMFMRSSMGIKHHLMLANGTGVIDSDYQKNIMCAIYNYGDDAVYLSAGDRICQGIFVPYYTCGDTVDTVRVDGIGSTGK